MKKSVFTLWVMSVIFI